MDNQEKSVIIYRSEDGSVQLEVQLVDDNVWLTQVQISELFEKDISVISRHIKNIYKEGELENALKKHMEQFLLELGRGFAFIGRQYMIPIGSRRFKVDLVFYHCILKCYVLIDLKRAEIKHGDIGQMNLYLNYFKTEICQPDDNPPIGIVLGTKKDELLMEKDKKKIIFKIGNSGLA